MTFSQRRGFHPEGLYRLLINVRKRAREGTVYVRNGRPVDPWENHREV